MNKPMVRIEIKLAICIIFLVVLALWVYWGSTGNQFVWDSVRYLFTYKDNISSLSFENLRWMATSLNFYNWHPLTWFSYALDYQFYGGLSLWGYHLSNNILHAINGVLVFVLVLTILGLVYPASETFSMKRDDDSLVAALMAASLFVVHPQNVESIAWVAERKNLLSQLFMMLSLLSYVKYATASQAVKLKWYLLTLGMFFLAVLSKPMAVTFPAVLLLADVYPLRRTSLLKPGLCSIDQQTNLRLFIEKIPFFLLTLVLVLATLKAQETAILEMPILQRVVNATHSTILYLENFVFPISLNPHYPYFVVTGVASALKALLVILVFSVITMTAIFAWRKQKPAFIIAWLFYLGTLVPVLGLVTVGAQGAADRYTYFPTLVLYLLLAAGIYLVLKGGSKLKKILLYTAVVSVVFLFAFKTSQQIRVWQNEHSLWSYVIELDPDNMFANNNLGIVYKNNAEYEQAALHFEAGDEDSLRPGSMLGWQAVTYMHLGRYKEAIDVLVKFGIYAESDVRLVVDPHCIQYNLGWNYAHLQMLRESKDLFERVTFSPNLGSDANEWLNALGNDNSTGDMLASYQDLPGICENLIPSQSRSQGVR